MLFANFHWAKATDVHIDKYKSNTHMILKTIDVPGAIFVKMQIARMIITTVTLMLIILLYVMLY